ncbi:type 2 lanthipeptide synthetase LanM family protein [Actinocrispum sp. NPDC049592]|uniref:type 2 lanthipeptide synthetase LanM family protein n=1 Tax=Actinocrispum sp. NPDC049592 TaxID=3154835 RepID=UPI00343D354D
MSQAISHRDNGINSGPWWTGALTAAERRWTVQGRPRWAELVDQAVATGPVSAEGAVPAEWPDAFAWVFRPLLRIARARVANAALDGKVDAEAVLAGFDRQLGRRLAGLAARTLVLELNVERVSGRLAGHTAEERFADFIRSQAGSDRLTQLFAEYPVLARLLGQACAFGADAMVELLERFTADRELIVARLLGGMDPGDLVEIHTGTGDTHQRGRSVAILRFADGRRVVYKPRSLDLHRHFGGLVSWLNTKVLGLGLRSVDSVTRTGYGWLEFVEHRPCSQVAEVDRFYRRQGALLALLYAIDAADIHYENLIACGDQPVLVDVETLFHPMLEQPTATGPDPAARVLASSVHRMALLPQMLLGEYGAVDISALGGDRGEYPDDGVAWDGVGTDVMRLVRRRAEFRGAVNRPRLGALDVEPAEYRAAMLGGFREGYDAIVRHRSELIGLLTACTNDEIRIVVRPSQTYATLLDESTHPDVLRDAVQRERVFDALTLDSACDLARQRLIPSELADLWAGDLPMFTSKPGSRDLLAADGECLPDLLEGPGLATVVLKIAAMDEVDRYDQEWLISAALATRANPLEHRTGETRPRAGTAAVPDPQRLLSAACGIADEIGARAMHGDGRANWLGLEPIIDKHWAVLPMGAGLAHGYCGVALYLAQLAELTGVQRYAELARDAVRPVPRLIDQLITEPELGVTIGCGGTHGLGGISYAIARLGNLLDDPEIRSWLPAVVDLTRAATDDELACFAAGSAGGLAAMLAVHTETGLPAAGRLAWDFADRLVEQAHTVPCTCLDTPSSGFAHGHTGIGWALMRFAQTGAGEPYAEVGQAILDAEVPDSADLSWCSGLSGFAMARRDTPADWVSTLADHSPIRDMSLCHGELGVTEALMNLAQRGGHPHAAMAATRHAGLLLGAIDRGGVRCGTPHGVVSAGLLNGLAGIGYGLLRLGFPHRVPSVLLLEPAP